MLEEMGGTVADRAEIEVGGRVLVGGEWLVVLRVNKTSGIINSLTTTPPIGVHWRKDWKHGIEEIKGYKAPSKDDAAKVKTATKLPPLCNYPGEGFLHMTKKEYDETVPKWSDFQKIGTLNSTETYGRHRVRQTRAPGGEYWQTALVYLTDQKRTDPPKPVPQPEFEAQMEALPEPKPTRLKPAKAAVVEFEAMRDSLKHGVQMVNTPQLFPTPPDLAERMVELAEIKTHHRVLEPSAGTGNIWRNLSGKRQGVEIHPDLANRLRDMVTQGDFGIICADFLECSPKELGNFDRIVMNPPFSNGQDIKHIQHALTMLKPGGRLVALCANGSRQQEQLKPVADYWEDLPSGSFASQGTGVNVALLTINIPDKLPAVKRRPAIQLELFGA
ncbi:Methyltransferase domain-containing protein [Methylomagnum ishizawai]|uniref:Methyltransferase domain-containing protein n=1 Tax=Methylomagnum ishizawai TaxID=1760988 RepID=A0A1Y6D391_9GAMM|nr:methyltransferase [Methylomagnum ishizawai]SMF97066.1 Methyltransferase domain-containing protein [Methylomagnum ishizawai]